MGARILVLSAAVLLLACPVLAQESASFKLNEHTFNAGGHPEQGTVLTSPSYKITLDAIGDSTAARDLSSASHSMDGGFVSGYPPPGEVMDLHFTDHQTLVWNPERSIGHYNLYRDMMSNVTGLGYGQCQQENLTDETTTDSDPVPGGDGFFYLVTAENRLDEEGIKGSDSGGVERQGNVCP